MKATQERNNLGIILIERNENYEKDSLHTKNTLLKTAASQTANQSF